MHFHHLHFYVEDVAFWRCWFIQKLAFCLASADSLTPTEPVVLRQGNVEIRLSGGQRAEVSAYLRHHPAGLADVALASERFDDSVTRAIAQGATLTQAVHLNAQGHRQCQFQGWADVRHTLVEADVQKSQKAPDALLQDIDHVVINVPQGELAIAADWYQRVFDLSFGQRFEINTARSGLRSQVLVHREGALQLPLNEPTSHSSQVQEFLQHNKGAGVQHVALRSHDAIRAIAQFRAQGLDLIEVPDTYYEQLPLRLDCPIENLTAVSQQRLLVDWAPGGRQGMLLQTFTKPIFAVPTFFFEIIERSCYLENGKPEVAQGFGEGNFQALFEAIERSQLARAAQVSLPQKTGDEP